MVIEAIRGGSYNSDIAIDELQFTKGKCVPKGDCDFEDRTACGYENDPTNKVDWLVYSGSTPSYHTGPSVDHTTGLSTGLSDILMISEFSKSGNCSSEQW